MRACAFVHTHVNAAVQDAMCKCRCDAFTGHALYINHEVAYWYAGTGACEQEVLVCVIEYVGSKALKVLRPNLLWSWHGPSVPFSSMFWW